MRHGHPATLAAGSSVPQPCHFSAGAGLVDEHQVLGIEISLRVEPSLPPAGYIRPVLLGGMRRFLSVIR